MSRLRRKLLVAGLSLLVVGALVIGLLFILVRAEPSWYRAVQLTEAQQVAGQNRLVNRLAALRNDVGRSQVEVEQSAKKEWPAFEVEITEEEVNAFLLRWGTTNPQVRAALRELQEPHVRFLDDRIEMAGRSVRMDTLLSIALSVQQTADGPRVVLSRPWAGRMPLARSLIEEPAATALRSLRDGPRSDVPAVVLDAADALIRGEPADPIVVVHTSLNTWLPARVEKLEIREGLLKATLRPIKE